jgi:hypothetical protein
MRGFCRVERLTECPIKLFQIGVGQMIEPFFYALVFCALLFAWSVFFVDRAGRMLCGSHPDTLARRGPHG